MNKEKAAKEALRLYDAFHDTSEGKEAWAIAGDMDHHPDTATDVVMDALEDLYKDNYSEADWDLIHEQLYEMVFAGIT